MKPELLAAIKLRTEAAEGRIPHLYRDNAKTGNATCGIGHRVSSFAAALELPFRPRIAAREWAVLMAAPAGMRAAAYAIDTLGRLSNTDIDMLLDQDLQAAEAELRTHLPEFDSYPDGVQAAVLDMGFNLGVPRLIIEFPHLVCAVKARDWAMCAQQCQRRGISDQRNAETAALFQEAV